MEYLDIEARVEGMRHGATFASQLLGGTPGGIWECKLAARVSSPAGSYEAMAATFLKMDAHPVEDLSPGDLKDARQQLQLMDEEIIRHGFEPQPSGPHWYSRHYQRPYDPDRYQMESAATFGVLEEGERPHRTEGSHPKRKWLAFALFAVLLLLGGVLLFGSQSGENDTSSTPVKPPDATNPKGIGERISWSTDASDFRQRPRGQKLTFQCPPSGTPNTVYGTDVYTDDSSICYAAVHAGSITLAEGGKATITLREGRAGYIGSTRNGVASQDWTGHWNWGFEIQTKNPKPQSNVAAISWSQAASDYSDQVGKRFTFKCPAGGEAASVWGTGTYTDDSSICTAGVHAGKISFEEGGTVTIVIADGASAFRGTSQNGVTSSDWSQWPRSFHFAG
ncbi:LCCL domain-containing protein [Streptomyces sp. NBC_01310]|uniref:LCCL domain-containing protein n=1 Tax=Streptomyces sp. NBC_01310 TaxID=2903820 RepID=UPI0035B5D8CE|nr:LCCL domain-containing protein [Streptomyces sp. NBC_01310]